MLLVTASRFSRAIQKQVWLHRVIEIGSDDGVVYHYTFQNRRISFRRGPAATANCGVRFATAGLGFRVLTTANRFEMMMEGLHNGAIHVHGDVAQYITREPEAIELDPEWTTASTQRKRLVIMRVPAGEPLESSD